jgi:hypothetical protein
LKFSKRTRIGNFKDNIFHPNELETLSRDISQVIAVVKSNEAIIVISGYDHIQSVVSNYKRTTFYLWIDKNGMNIVFGDIQDDTSKEASRNFYEYTQIKPISLAVSPDENEVLEDKSFSFKKVEGFTNRKWLVFSLDTTPSTLPPAKL